MDINTNIKHESYQMDGMELDWQIWITGQIWKIEKTLNWKSTIFSLIFSKVGLVGQV